MTEAENGGLHSSQLFWNSDSGGLFVKYQPKSKKTVCLLSSMHRSPDVDQTTVKKKPEIVLFYNKNKVGVDCFDQMARLYTTRSATRRWPMSMWGNMLDIAAINAWILYKKSQQNKLADENLFFVLWKHSSTEWETIARKVTYFNVDRTALQLGSVGIVMEQIVRI